MQPTVGRICCAEHVVKGFIVKRLCVLNLLPLREKISVIMTRFFQQKSIQDHAGGLASVFGWKETIVLTNIPLGLVQICDASMTNVCL